MNARRQGNGLFPGTAVLALHGVTPGVPVVEGSHKGHLGGFGGFDGKGYAKAPGLGFRLDFTHFLFSFCGMRSIQGIDTASVQTVFSRHWQTTGRWNNRARPSIILPFARE
jgi:hypothetical protein